MPLDIFGDFGFAGASATVSDQYQDAQTCFNFYPEVSQTQTAKTVTGLLGCPGLVQVAADPSGGAPGNQTTTWPKASTVTNLPVRGMWALPGQVTALVVIGTTCYLATLTTRGSQTTPPVVTLTSVGTLLTSAGPVCIRDNNSGGYALIVDGTYGYTYNLSTQAFAQITDTNFTSFANPSTVAFIDGWWIVGTVGSQKFFTNSPIYSTSWDATFFALKDGASDNLMAVIENKEQLWLIGERTTEIWYDAGSQNFAFQRIYGQLIQYGCAATYSVSRLTSNGGTGIISSDSLIWLGRNNRGENVVVRTQGFNIGIVSTNEVSNSIAQMTDVSDAIGYTYEEDGHEFYVLTFPSADITWVYDSTMPPEFAWHQRGSYDPYTQTEHRHRSNCEMNFGGTTLVGDYQNGAIYQMTRSAYTDAGWPLLARRRSPFVWNPQSRRRVQMASLQVAFAPGVGNSANMGSDPQASLRISRDYGTTYGPPILAALGKIGNFVNRCIWRKLGWSRGAVAQIEVIDPVRRDIVGVTLKAFGS